MNCPRCTTPLERVDLAQSAVEHSDVTIDRCPMCRGTWYDKGELASSDERPWANVEDLPLQPVEVGAPLTCPRCGSPMAAVTVERLSELVLDRCPGCAGFWLDAGELPALRAYVDRLDRTATSDTPQPGTVVDPDGAELLLFVVDDEVTDDADAD